jgi:class 3 adenylate cyclase
MKRPETKYARSGDVMIAYQVMGEGNSIDLVMAPGTVSHLELAWEWPEVVWLHERLSSFARFIRFDKRGTGMSDRPVGVATLEERTDDIRAVMDAAESERAFILGYSEGGNMACLFAATYPQRTMGIVLWGVQRPAPPIDRVLATVLFTDIVGSTKLAAEIGDARWKQLLAEHDARSRAEIERHRGRFVDSQGDGLLATFDGPARAVRCAQAIAAAIRPLGLEIRAGAHTGEVELVGDRVQGIAVHIGARVSALAGTSEIVVSSTVKDLTAGSGLVFEDAGEHVLKGVPDRWHLYRVVG